MITAPAPAEPGHRSTRPSGRRPRVSLRFSLVQARRRPPRLFELSSSRIGTGAILATCDSASDLFLVARANLRPCISLSNHSRSHRSASNFTIRRRTNPSSGTPRSTDRPRASSPQRGRPLLYLRVELEPTAVDRSPSFEMVSSIPRLTKASSSTGTREVCAAR